MTPKELITELERITTIIDDPNSDNLAGRVDTLKYDVLPKLLTSERQTILKALRIAYPKVEQLSFGTQLETCKHGTPFRYECDECVSEIEHITHHENTERIQTEMDGDNEGDREDRSGETGA